ncbi:MAG: hypothetical protein WB587_08470, partial [Nitrososphaeraceae archaeon]
ENISNIAIDVNLYLLFILVCFQHFSIQARLSSRANTTVSEHKMLIPLKHQGSYTSNKIDKH